MLNTNENWSKKDGSIIAQRGKAARLVERFISQDSHAPRLLDVGSGKGFFIETLPPRCIVDAADYKNFLSPAPRARVASFTAVDLNGPWPFQGGAYDAVTAWNVLEHLENPFHFAREAARLLKRGGLLFVAIPNIFNWRSRLSFLRTGEMSRYRVNNSHITPFTKTTLQKIFSSFTLLERGYTGYDPPFFSKQLGFGWMKRRLKGSEGFGQTLYLVLQKSQ